MIFSSQPTLSLCRVTLCRRSGHIFVVHGMLSSVIACLRCSVQCSHTRPLTHSHTSAQTQPHSHTLTPAFSFTHCLYLAEVDEEGAGGAVHAVVVIAGVRPPHVLHPLGRKRRTVTTPHFKITHNNKFKTHWLGTRQGKIYRVFFTVYLKTENDRSFCYCMVIIRSVTLQ